MRTMPQPELSARSLEVYPLPHRVVHWTMAVLIIAMVPVGVYMASIPYPPAPGANPEVKDRLYELHKSFGIIVFLLACARVLMRLTVGVPAPAPTLTRFERIASTSVHHLLYVLIFLVPLAGWTATSMCYGPVNIFWTIPATLPLSGSEATCGAIYRVHFGAAFLMTLLVFAHVGGALMHLVIKRDGVFRRMWF